MQAIVGCILHLYQRDNKNIPKVKFCVSTNIRCKGVKKGGDSLSIHEIYFGNYGFIASKGVILAKGWFQSKYMTFYKTWHQEKSEWVLYFLKTVLFLVVLSWDDK